MNSRQKLLQFIYIILAIIMVIIEAQNLSSLRFIVKPILMPILIIILLANSKSNEKINWAILALLLSGIGDILLLFNQQAYFMSGLISFLLAHICYIIVFLKDVKFKELKYKFNGIFIAIMIIYLICFYLIINKNLDTLKIPVIIYMIIISFMAVAAAIRKYFVNNNSFFWVLFGAIFFIISDSSLAIMKFVISFQGAGILVIITYMIAQLCIVRGIIFNRIN